MRYVFLCSAISLLQYLQQLQAIVLQVNAAQPTPQNDWYLHFQMQC